MSMHGNLCEEQVLTRCHHHACPYPAGNPWFKVKKVSKDEYKEMLERNKPTESEDGKKSPKDKIDEAW